MANPSPSRYHPLQVTLHWLIVVLLVAAFPLGKYMSGLPNDAAKLPYLAIHLALGGLTLIVIMIRLIARLRLPRPAHAATGNVFLDWLGKAVHYALYALVFLMTLSGVSLSIKSGLMPIVFGGSGATLPADFHDFTARLVHGVAAPALLILVLLHVAGVIYHQFRLKNNLLARMWFGK